MRLIFVNRFFYPDHSATSQMPSDLCFALAARGHEVHVVTSRLRYDDPSNAFPANETVSGVAVHRVWTSRFGRSTAGRPVPFVGASGGEIADLVHEGRCGQAFAVGDAQGLANCVCGLAAHRALAREWGANGRRLFDERFAMPIALDRWERLLADVWLGDSKQFSSADAARRPSMKL